MFIEELSTRFQAFAVNVSASCEYLGSVAFHCITLFNSPKKVHVKTRLLIISKNVGERTNIICTFGPEIDIFLLFKNSKCIEVEVPKSTYIIRS